jgi:hypothetical protein
VRSPIQFLVLESIMRLRPRLSALTRPATLAAALALVGLVAVPAPRAVADSDTSFSIGFGLRIGDDYRRPCPPRPYYHRPRYGHHVERSVTRVQRSYHPPVYQHRTHHSSTYLRPGFHRPAWHRPAYPTPHHSSSVTVIRRHAAPPPVYCPPPRQTFIHQKKVVRNLGGHAHHRHAYADRGHRTHDGRNRGGGRSHDKGKGGKGKKHRN